MIISVSAQNNLWPTNHVILLSQSITQHFAILSTMPSGNNPIPNHVLKRRRIMEHAMASRGGVITPAPAVAEFEIATHPEHAAALLETEKNTVASFPKYRCMVAEMIKWWQSNYPELYENIVFKLTEEDKKNLTQHYYNATHDLRYDLLDPKWVKLFLSGAKK